MIQRFFALLFCITMAISSPAQIIYQTGKPGGLKLLTHTKSLSIIKLPQTDLTKTISKNKCPKCKIMPIGKIFRYNIDFKKNATLIKNENENIWYLMISSPMGKALSITFSKFKIPPKAKLYLYSEDEKFILGPITYKNNKTSTILPTRYIPTRQLIIEYHEQINAEKSDFLIRDIIVYTSLFSSSQYCEVNINCPEGAAWQTDKKAVAKIIFTSGLSQYLCTGALVGNTAQNRIPYFLTAHHCISTHKEAQSAVFYFNYEASDCQGNNILPEQTLSGAELIATGSNSSGEHLDFSLLRLSAIPPYTYKPYFAGWSRISDPKSIDSTICIHHPSGDIKKITKDFDSPTIGSFPDGYDPNTHWHILQWDIGTTEGGSSGSPLFDQNHRIIGDLTGGDATCENNVNDYFAQFYQSWDKYSDTLTQLRHWLDPLNYNPTYLDGYDPYQNYIYLPPVTQIYGYATLHGATIHWLPPDYSGDSLIYDGFEQYNDFSLAFPNWSQKDLDTGITWGIEGVQFENENYIGSFIIFNPNLTQPVNPTGWTPHSGDKMLICFDAQPPNNPNNDWLISKKFLCTAQHKLVFYARSVTDSFGLERIRVLISEKSSDTKDFIPISQEPYELVPTHWTRFVYDLSKFSGKKIYIAINIISDNSFALLLDDISITNLPITALKNYNNTQNSLFNRESAQLTKSYLPKYKAPTLIGYKIFRNYKQIAQLDTSQLYYTDTTLLPAKYYVVASYDLGEANASPEILLKQYSDSLTIYDRDNAITVQPNPIYNGRFKVVLNHPVQRGKLIIFNIYGKQIMTTDFNNMKEKSLYLPSLQAGVYIIVLDVLSERYKTLFIVL